MGTGDGLRRWAPAHLLNGKHPGKRHCGAFIVKAGAREQSRRPQWRPRSFPPCSLFQAGQVWPGRATRSEMILGPWQGVREEIEGLWTDPVEVKAPDLLAPATCCVFMVPVHPHSRGPAKVRTRSGEEQGAEPWPSARGAVALLCPQAGRGRGLWPADTSLLPGGPRNHHSSSCPPRSRGCCWWWWNKNQGWWGRPGCHRHCPVPGRLPVPAPRTVLGANLITAPPPPG